MSLLPFLCPAKGGTKPAASWGLLSIVNKVYKEVGSALASRNCKVSCKEKQGEYQIASDAKKVVIGKYASEHGVGIATRKFKEKNLKDITVRDWHNYYNCVVARLWKEAKWE